MGTSIMATQGGDAGATDLEMGMIANDEFGSDAKDSGTVQKTEEFKEQGKRDEMNYQTEDKFNLSGRSVKCGWGIITWYFLECSLPPSSGYVRPSFDILWCFIVLSLYLVFVCTVYIQTYCIHSVSHCAIGSLLSENMKPFLF